jgi:hypothetical protein
MFGYVGRFGNEFGIGSERFGKRWISLNRFCRVW